jgi:hypothetical protein
MINNENALVDALVLVVAKAGKGMTGYICHEVAKRRAERREVEGQVSDLSATTPGVPELISFQDRYHIHHHR